jgi:hypothetical protein
MGFVEALRAAGLERPGRTTWHGTTPDGTSVFTVWAKEIRQVGGRHFVWWDHNGERVCGELSDRRKQQGMAYIRHAQQVTGTICRAVVVRGDATAESAVYPHAQWARIKFLTVIPEAMQFVAELLPPE